MAKVRNGVSAGTLSGGFDEAEVTVDHIITVDGEGGDSLAFMVYCYCHVLIVMFGCH